jgi:GntR family transcriptional regulator
MYYIRRSTSEGCTVPLIEVPKAQFVQIADLLRKRIDDGTYPPGSVLPSEPQLADELGVNRITVNRAVSLLRSAGYVKVRRGSGTTVRKLPKIHRDAQARYAARTHGTGAGEVEVTRLGLQSRTVYIEIGEVTPPARVASTLGLGADESALIRRRVLYAGDEPTQAAVSYYPWSIARGTALTEEATGTGGSYSRLADLGYPIERFTEEVNVRMPTDEERGILDLELSEPVFEIWHVAYTTGDRPISVTVHVMAGHLWTLHYSWHDPAADSRRR